MTRLSLRDFQAARSVKWLNKVRISDEEAYSTWVRGFAYKSMGHSNTFEGTCEDAGNGPTPTESAGVGLIFSWDLVVCQVWMRRSFRLYRNSLCNQRFVSQKIKSKRTRFVFAVDWLTTCFVLYSKLLPEPLHDNR